MGSKSVSVQVGFNPSAGKKPCKGCLRSWLEQKKKGGWIQKATASIKRRGTKGKCTPITKPGCTGRARALALTFKKMARNRKRK